VDCVHGDESGVQETEQGDCVQGDESGVQETEQGDCVQGDESVSTGNRT